MGKSLYFVFHGEEWTRQVRYAGLGLAALNDSSGVWSVGAVASCLESGLVLTSAGGYSEYENPIWEVVRCGGSEWLGEKKSK